MLAATGLFLWLSGTPERDVIVRRGVRDALEREVVDESEDRRAVELPTVAPPIADAREEVAATAEVPSADIEEVVEERVVSTTRLRGRVVLADGGTPAPGAQVHVTPRGWMPELSRFDSEPSLGPSLFAWTRADSEGRFELPRGLHGTYAIHATLNRWLVTTTDPIEFVAGQDRDLLLALPPAGALRGSIRAPVGVPLEEFTLVIRPRAEPTLEEFVGEIYVLVPLKREGTFESGFFPPMELSIGLRGPKARLPRGFWEGDVEMPELELGAWQLREGTIEGTVIDLRERWFGSIRAHVTSAGQPLRRFVVEARPASSAQYFSTRPPVSARGRTRTTSWVGASTSDDGVAELEFVTPGEWSVRVMPSDRLEQVPAPEVVQVRAGAETDWAVDVGPLSGGAADEPKPK